MFRRRKVGLCALLAVAWTLVLPALPCAAQWITQTFNLAPGWNPVYLAVKPEPADCDTVFRDHPEVTSVWRWDRQFNPVEFDVDPALVFAEPDHWAAWLATNQPGYAARTLLALQSSRAYLIHVATNAAAFTWAVKGRPAVPRTEWLPNAFNLVGMPVNPAHPPTFTAYFAACPQVNAGMGANQIYTINNQGQEFAVRNTARETLQAGQAYWVKCGNITEYSGALDVAGNVDFGRTLVEQEISLRNRSTNQAITVTLTQIASETPPAGQPELAGPVPLSYYYSNLAANQWGWSNFPAAGLTQTIAPAATWTLRLGLRRSELNPYTPIGAQGAAYQGILQASDSGQSLLYRIPVQAASETVHPRLAGAQATDTLDPAHPYQGLWVGEGILNWVGTNYPLVADVNTAAAFAFRLIVFVDDTGNAALYQRVLLAGLETTVTNIQQNSYGDWSTSVVVRVDYQLYSTEADVPANAGDVYRVSSAAFPAYPGGGALAQFTGSFSNGLTCAVGVDYNDPVNPFKHVYHPDHDNLAADFSTVLPEGVESYTVTRSVNLQFTNNAVMTSPFWGVNEIGGNYAETINGLFNGGQPIYAAGSFHLERISTAGDIDP